MVRGNFKFTRDFGALPAWLPGLGFEVILGCLCEVDFLMLFDVSEAGDVVLDDFSAVRHFLSDNHPK